MARLVEDNEKSHVQRALMRLRELANAHDEWGGLNAYACALTIEDALGRIRIHERLPGRALWDREPIVFDDLIEVRVGGDKALAVALDPTDRRPAPQVFMLPLLEHDFSVFLEQQLEPFLHDMEDTPHVIPMSPNSSLEEVASMEWGYRPCAKTDTGLRFYTPDRYWARLRDDFLTASIAPPPPMPRASSTRTNAQWYAVNDENYTLQYSNTAATPTLRESLRVSYDEVQRMAAARLNISGRIHPPPDLSWADGLPDGDEDDPPDDDDYTDDYDYEDEEV
ncbi:MAG TPA: hypothetical protein VNC22_23350 [Sporichthya sp.]|jgi:hypothetical protein|nr:hypothetical protein [Sporichthya sp.]